MPRTHDAHCRCAPCRHERFQPGAPSAWSKLRSYGWVSPKWREKRPRVAAPIKPDEIFARIDPWYAHTTLVRPYRARRRRLVALQKAARRRTSR